MTTEELVALAEQLRPHLGRPKPPVAEPPVDDVDLAEGTEMVDGEIIYVDPTAKLCDEVEGNALKALPLGQGIYRGKNGTQIINHSQESLEAVAAYRKNRRQFRTRSRI